MLVRTYPQSVLLARKVFIEATAELTGVQQQFIVGHGEKHFVNVHQIVGGSTSDNCWRTAATLYWRHLLYHKGAGPKNI